MDSCRSFLRGLAFLPVIGGAVALVGNPTAAAVPVTLDLLHPCRIWLHVEHCIPSFDLTGHDQRLGKEMERFHLTGSPGDRGPAGSIDAPQPSTRAAVILSAAGVLLVGGRA